MAHETAAGKLADAPLPKSLTELVERAITDTPGLSDEQIRSIRQTVEPWYEYYREHPPDISEALDFADTEQIRRQQVFMRQMLADYVTGWNTLSHVYYAVEMVMVTYVKAYIEKMRAADHPETALKPGSDATGVTAGENAPPTTDEEAPRAGTRSRNRKPTTGGSKQMPSIQSKDQQIGLFG